MAGPHVVGVIALILSARPDLAGEVDLLEDILEQSAVESYDTIPCGSVAGDAIPNNTYGHGRVDALAALSAALAASPIATPVKPEILVKISPNPVSDLAIFHTKNLTGKATLDIFSADGKLVFTKNWVALGDQILQIPLQAQTAGLYFWKISAENGSASGKLIKK